MLHNLGFAVLVLLTWAYTNASRNTIRNSNADINQLDKIFAARVRLPEERGHKTSATNGFVASGTPSVSANGVVYKRIRIKPKLLATGIINYSKLPPVRPVPFPEEEERGGRSGIALETRRWNGSILFVIDTTFTSSEIKVIREAAEELRSVVCIEVDLLFILEKNDIDLGRPYVRITKKAKGCSSKVGRFGDGEQLLKLKPKSAHDDGCFHKHVIVHEMIHALGFFHEHIRPDREDFITIHKKNIIPGTEHNFVVQESSLTFGVPYDYYSIMHYLEDDFADNPEFPAMSAKIAGINIGSRGLITLSDEQKIKRMYKCPGICMVQSEGKCMSDDDCCPGLYCVLYSTIGIEAGVCRDPKTDEYRLGRSDGRPIDCLEILLTGKKESGVYQIYPDITSDPIHVYCDMDTDGGGWTVVLQRGKRGTIRYDFNKSWDEYDQGFGDIHGGDYNIGLKNLHSLTLEHDQEMRIDLSDWIGNYVFVLYRNFWIEGPQVNYRLMANDSTGNITRISYEKGLEIVDAMATSNGNLFTTYDRDHIKRGGVRKNVSCAIVFGGGWWFDENCSQCFLNGRYQSEGANNIYVAGMFWEPWTTEVEEAGIIKTADMKVRNRFFSLLRSRIEK